MCERANANQMLLCGGDASSELTTGTTQRVLGVRVELSALKRPRTPGDVKMADRILAEEVTDFVIQVFHKDSTGAIEDWRTLTPIELGILSWQLDNIYCCPLWWIEVSTVEMFEEPLYRSDVL